MGFDQLGGREHRASSRRLLRSAYSERVRRLWYAIYRMATIWTLHVHILSCASRDIVELPCSWRHVHLDIPAVPAQSHITAFSTLSFLAVWEFPPVRTYSGPNASRVADGYNLSRLDSHLCRRVQPEYLEDHRIRLGRSADIGGDSDQQPWPFTEFMEGFLHLSFRL